MGERECLLEQLVNAEFEELRHPCNLHRRKVLEVLRALDLWRFKEAVRSAKQMN